MSSGTADQDVLDEHRGKYLSLDQLHVLVVELLVDGRALAAYELVAMKLSELESEVRFPWTNSARYRALSAVKELVARYTFRDRAYARIGELMSKMTFGMTFEYLLEGVDAQPSR